MRAPVIRLSPAAAEAVAAEAPASVDGNETGGILLGHDHGDTIHVVVAGDPGPNADRRPDGFLRDLAHARRLADEAYERDASVWIGEWHTHPGGPATPSPTDMETYRRLLADTELGFEQIVSLITVPCATHGWAEINLIPWIVTGDGARLATLKEADVAKPENVGDDD